MSASDSSEADSDSSLGRRFWSLWAAFTATNLADGLSLVAFPLLAVELTDDARLIAMVTAFRFIPFIVVGLPAGVLLDRVDRRNVAVVAQIGRAASIGVVAVSVRGSGGSIALLVAAAFVIGVGEVLTDGGLPALVRDLVRRDQLEVANARIVATQTVSNVFVGPPVGALLFSLDAAAPFALSLVLFAVAATMLARIPGRFRATALDAGGKPDLDNGPSPTPGPRWHHRMIGEISVGLRYVWSHRVLRPLAFTVMAFSFVGQAGNAVFVVLVTERFGLGEIGFGMLISIQGVASVAMSFAVTRLVGRVGHTGSMRFAVITMTVASLMLGLSTVIAVAVVASLIKGLSDPAWNVITGTVRQRLVPDEVFGRMMTAYLFIAWSMNPVGAMVGGVIAQRWGAQWVSVMAAVVVGSLLVFGRGLFRAIDEAMTPGSA